MDDLYSLKFDLIYKKDSVDWLILHTLDFSKAEDRTFFLKTLVDPKLQIKTIDRVFDIVSGPGLKLTFPFLINGGYEIDSPLQIYISYKQLPLLGNEIIEALIQIDPDTLKELYSFFKNSTKDTYRKTYDLLSDSNKVLLELV